MLPTLHNWTSYLRRGLLLLCLCTAATVYAQESNTDDRIAAVVAATEPTTIQQLDSPDGSQRVEVTVYPCVAIGEQETSYERLDVIDNRTGEIQLLAEQVINCQGLGAFGLWVQKWSDNGAFLYYTDAREGMPDGLATGWVPPLWRIQMVDYQAERLGPARFSPDGRWLAAWNQTSIQVISANATDSTDFTLLPADLLIMEVVWLPDSSGVLYLQADTPFASSRSAVTVIDLNTLEQTLLLDNGQDS